MKEKMLEFIDKSFSANSDVKHGMPLRVYDRKRIHNFEQLAI